MRPGIAMMCSGREKPKDPHWANVVSLLHFDGADGSTTFTDEKGSTWTTAGNTQIDTAQSKFGGSSGSFDGAGDYMTTPYSADLNLASGDFTLEAWVRLNAITPGDQMILNKDGVFGLSYPSYSMQIANGKLRMYVGSGDSTAYAQGITGTTALSTDTWYHIAATRSGSTLRVFVNGIKDAEATQSGTPVDGGKALYSGNYANNVETKDMLNGHIEELRITKGVARYTDNFTPPAAPFPDN